MNHGINGGKNLEKQSDLVREFMKVLCLAHGCVSETFKGPNGQPTRFYNGPSPDEVALVEFAASMEYECTFTGDNEVKAIIPEQFLTESELEERIWDMRDRLDRFVRLSMAGR